MQKYGSDNWQMYQESAFVGLDFEKLKEISVPDLLEKFNTLKVDKPILKN